MVLWHFFTGREAKAIQGVVADFEAANPGIKVVVKSGQDDTKATQAIAAGKGPDVDLSYSTDITGTFCSDGAFKDLGPYIARDKVDLSQIPEGGPVLHGVQGRALRDAVPVRHVRPLLQQGAAGGGRLHRATEDDERADCHGQEADEVQPRRLDQGCRLRARRSATTRMSRLTTHRRTARRGRSPTARRASAPTANWQPYLQWITAMTKFYGQAKLAKFVAGAGQEFSADNDFEKGKVAMMMDGEYRNAFIKAEHPELSYATAPFPTADNKTNLYGAGYITGNIIGIGKGAKNPEAAWALIKYLTTDTAAMVKLANGIKNVPTTTPALQLAGPRRGRQLQDVPRRLRQRQQRRRRRPAPTAVPTRSASRTGSRSGRPARSRICRQGLDSVDKQIDAALKLGTAP